MSLLRHLRANFLVAQGRMSEAVPLFRDILRSNPVDAVGIEVVLSDCRKRGDVDEALGLSKRALAVDDHHFSTLQTLGWAHIMKGDHAAARPAIVRALQQFQDSGLGESSSALRMIDQFLRFIGRIPLFRRRFEKRSRRNVDESATAALKAWETWAKSYLASQEGARLSASHKGARAAGDSSGDPKIEE
jgi:tetratricopeptide (TPR) repeat protein